MAALQLLLVDDDAVDRLAVRRALRDGGVEAAIDECTNADDAVAAVRARQYDCVLLDYYLPGSTGLETLNRIRALGARVPVVALTGQGDEDLAVTLMKAGAADYLAKNGLSGDRLARSLRYAMALHRSEEQRRDLLEREQEARMEAQRANRAKDEFLATLSHELRTPLNAILGWTSLLASGQLDAATTRKALAIIERNTRVQAQLIGDLLDISRIVTGKLRLDMKPLSVRTVVNAALESVRPVAEQSDVRVEVSIDEDATVTGDQARIQQVVWNLLNNAMKFTPSGGWIRVTASRDGGQFLVTVTDSGTGISPEFLPYVFDRFRQEDGAATREHAGLGIGLSIVRHVVELHGGTVTAHSEGEGKGASFVVAFPVAADAADTAPGPSARPAARATR